MLEPLDISSLASIYPFVKWVIGQLDIWSNGWYNQGEDFRRWLIPMPEEKELKAWLTVSIAPAQRKEFHAALVKLRRADPMTPVSQIVVKLIVDAAQKLDETPAK
jgi:hypothetical protein